MATQTLPNGKATLPEQEHALAVGTHCIVVSAMGSGATWQCPVHIGLHGMPPSAAAVYGQAKPHHASDMSFVMCQCLGQQKPAQLSRPQQ
jgi:hypothetical protein